MINTAAIADHESKGEHAMNAAKVENVNGYWLASKERADGVTLYGIVRKDRQDAEQDATNMEREEGLTTREFLPNVKPAKGGDLKLEETLYAAQRLSEVTCGRCDGEGVVLAVVGDRDVPIRCGRCFGKGWHLEFRGDGYAFADQEVSR